MNIYHGTTARSANCIEREGFRGSVLSEFTNLGEYDDEGGVVFAAFTAAEASEYGDAIFEITINEEFIHPFNDGNTDHCYIILADVVEFADWVRL